jgi:hypothetical protein
MWWKNTTVRYPEPENRFPAIESPLDIEKKTVKNCF